MTSGYSSHFDGAATPGVIQAVAEQSVLVDPGDMDAVRQALSGQHQIAAVILEPTGSSFGQVPLSAEFVQELRAETERTGVVLILDEVGDRLPRQPGRRPARLRRAAGPDQPRQDPGRRRPRRRVAGRRDILDHLDVAASRAAGREKIQHQGTYNANPVSAAAGVAALEMIEATDRARGPRRRPRCCGTG